MGHRLLILGWLGFPGTAILRVWDHHVQTYDVTTYTAQAPLPRRGLDPTGSREVVKHPKGQRNQYVLTLVALYVSYLYVAPWLPYSEPLKSSRYAQFKTTNSTVSESWWRHTLLWAIHRDYAFLTYVPPSSKYIYIHNHAGVDRMKSLKEP